ncbi:MAG: hypothetical protein WC415_01850 [Patescibacteria group bacterium]
MLTPLKARAEILASLFSFDVSDLVPGFYKIHNAPYRARGMDGMQNHTYERHGRKVLMYNDVLF